MTGRYCFHRCLSVNILRGYPVQIWMVEGGVCPISGLGGVPHPGLGEYPIQGRGYPIPGGIPHPRGYPILWGTPSWEGTPSQGSPGQVWGGTPSWGVPQVPPTSRPGQGTPPIWGTPPPRSRPGRDTPDLGWGTPSPPPRAVCLLRSRRRTFLFNITVNDFDVEKFANFNRLFGVKVGHRTQECSLMTCNF